MNNSLKYTVGLAILFSTLHSVSAMEIQSYQLPSQGGLKERFNQAGFRHFIEKTNLDEILGDTKKATFEVILEVDHAFYTYDKYIQEPIMLKSMLANKPKIIALILQDHPEALKEFQDRNCRIK